ncbi:PadR family transcriptional regulator [Nocardioides terrisoli]|uniref:PadR family transcriptional regulator n=1 Tax=Nocardioides terrisoli TaxID=3388267 RepID=UPI00287B8F3E|nr:PadR family transcriptional regulator [Nocardioides marmorisolisilvae]
MRANKMWNPELAHQMEAVRRAHASRGRGAGRGAGFGPGFGPGPGQGFGGSGAFFGPAWGPVFGPGGRGGHGHGRGSRVRRGDVRSAILDVLATSDDELNGYQVIQTIAERTDGAWRPSPGSVYPTIAQLEDEGLVETVTGPGRKVLRLTEAGRAHHAEHADEIGAVWDAFQDEDDDHGSLKHVVAQTMTAVWQVAMTGTPDQQQRAAEVLAETRRKLYGILADGPSED